MQTYIVVIIQFRWHNYRWKYSWKYINWHIFLKQTNLM